MNPLSAPWSVYDTPWFTRPGFEAYAEAYRNPPGKRIPRPKVDHYWTGEPLEIERHPKGRWEHNGYVIYEGPSRFDKKPIVVIATGFRDPSENEKTGRMIQTWILRADMDPQEAVWAGGDSSICGGCVHRGEVVMVMKKFMTKAGTRSKVKRRMPKSEDRSCYVQVVKQPRIKYRFYKEGRYPKVPISQLPELFRGAPPLRIGSYGDPVAAPAKIWKAALKHQVAWTGYTHAWKDTRLASSFKSFCMASVDSPEEQRIAEGRGWRTFRIGRKNEPLIAGVEIICPATPEGGMKTTCDACNLCMGATKQARSIVTAPHGSGKVGIIERRGKRLPSLNPSPGHTHPMLAEPVPRGRVIGELYDLYYRTGLPGDPELSWPNSMAKTHARDSRRYAQVFIGAGPSANGQGRPRVELAEQVRWLPRQHRRGLLAHEIGHALAPDGTEDDADEAALEATGVRIGYDHRWPGKGLQVARRSNPDESRRRHERRAAGGDLEAQQRLLAERRRRGAFRPSMENVEEYLQAFPGQTAAQVAGFWGTSIGSVAMILGRLEREGRAHSNYEEARREWYSENLENYKRAMRSLGGSGQGSFPAKLKKG